MTENRGPGRVGSTAKLGKGVGKDRPAHRAGQFGDGLHYAGFVIRPHNGNNAGVRADGCLQIAEVDATVKVDRDECRLVAAFLEQVA